jgi:hypothetical protein
MKPFIYSSLERLLSTGLQIEQIWNISSFFSETLLKPV